MEVNKGVANRAFVIMVSLFLMAANAHAVEAWGRWNIAPYATSLGEACRKAPATIDGFNMPSTVKEAFKGKVAATCEGGSEVWLTPHQPIEQMWSGPDRQHRAAHMMNKVTVGELPVLRSPDGRAYRKGAVAETAKALSWTVEHEGKTYVLYLPYVCFNWGWAFGPSTLVVGPPAKKKCVELPFNAHIGGKVRWGTGTTTGPLSPDECNAQRQGGGPWTAWYGECDECVPAIGYIRGILGETAQVPHKYLYTVTARQQTLRFSTAVWETLVYVCLEDANGRQTCGVYTRPQDWEKRYHVPISDFLWKWDDGNCK